MSSQAALKEYYIDRIHENGYVPLSVPITGADIDPVFASFGEVISDVFDCPGERSQDIIDAFKVVHPKRPLDSPGFIQQRRIGEINPFEIGRAAGTDNKDVLHFTPLTEPKVYSYLATRGGVPYSVRRLVEQCTEISQAVTSSVRPFLKTLGLETSMLAPKGLEGENIHLVRLIRYVGNRGIVNTKPYVSSDDLAELHFDRSKFTAALWESSSGLVGAPGNNAYGDRGLTVERLDEIAATALTRPIQHRSGEMKIFAGAGYNRLPREARENSGRLPLLLHGVTDNNPDADRNAIVVFINEHAGATASVADYTETGLSDVRDAVIDRQLRHGGMVA